VEPSATRALKDPDSLVLGDDALDPGQQSALRSVVRNGPLDEEQLDTGTSELLKKDYLVGVFSRETVGGVDVHPIDRAFGDEVTKALQAGTLERRTSESVVDALLDRAAHPVSSQPIAELGELAVDRRLTHLSVRGDPGVQSCTKHHSPPPWLSV